MTAPLALSKSRSGSEKRKRAGVVGFRATADERAELDAKAKRAGLVLSAYIRESVLATPQIRSRRRPSIELELLAKAVAQLGRVGGNLHQIAKRLNFGEIQHAAELPTAIAEFREVVTVLMAAAGRTPR